MGTKSNRLGADLGDFANTQRLWPSASTRFKEAGPQWVGLEFTFPDHFASRARDFKVEAGFDVTSYNFMYWSDSDASILTTGRSSVRAHLDALEAMRESNLTLGWYRTDDTFVPEVFWDAEEFGPTPSPDRVVALLATAVEWATAAGFASGIYTGEYVWKLLTRDAKQFAYLPLWHASQFDNTVPVPMADFYKGHEYGNWPVPMLWQHRGTATVGGLSCDLDLEEWTDPT